MTSNPALAQAIIESLQEGIVVIDRDWIIQVFNPAAEVLTGLAAADRIGQKAEERSQETSLVHRIFETGETLFGVETRMKDGRIFRVNYLPLFQGDEVSAVVQSFTDITAQRTLEEELKAAKQEIDDAFAFTLPDSRVEEKLKSTPEYVDVFDPETGTATVTAVIPEGGYRHVINALKLAADLRRQGLFEHLGIDKAVLVDTLLYHDIGKVQPKLRVGDVFYPEETFENGRLHASRGARVAAEHGCSPAAVQLIRYHHHEESELPKTFDRSLLPTLRLFRLVDGLSASITRRNGAVILEVDKETITVHEQNNHPFYTGSRRVNLRTGEVEVISQGELSRPGLRLWSERRSGVVSGGFAARPEARSDGLLLEADGRAKRRGKTAVVD